MKDKRLHSIWGISLMVLGVLALIVGITAVAGYEIPHMFKMMIAVVQIISGIVVIVATVLKLKK